MLLCVFPSSAVAVSRAYPRGCSHEPSSYYDYDSLQFPPSNLPIRSHDDFALLRRLGAGKFSDVFEAVELFASSSSSSSEQQQQQSAVDHHDSALCVIKCLKPVSERKIKRELLVLSHVSKLPNLARLKAVVLAKQQQQKQQIGSFYDNNGKMPSIVLEHAGRNARWLCHGLGCDPTSLSSTTTTTTTKNQMKEHGTPSQQRQHDPPYHLTEYEIKYYLCHLLIALDALHSRGIMHRDVKPRNILINRHSPPLPAAAAAAASAVPAAAAGDESRLLDLVLQDPPSLMLIDLGLADFYLPHQNYNVRVASRHYKAPELLLGNEYYDYGIDMWGVGCILAGLLLRREPMFRGKDNVDQLGKIVAILGSRDLYEYVDKYGLKLDSDLKRVIQKYTARQNPTGKRKSWLSLLMVTTNANTNTASSSSSTKNEKSDIRTVSKKSVMSGKEQQQGRVPVPSKEGIDLLDQLLVYDHEKRLTAREAMMHPFFDDVRDLVVMEVQTRWAMEQQKM